MSDSSMVRKARKWMLANGFSELRHSNGGHNIIYRAPDGERCVFQDGSSKNAALSPDNVKFLRARGWPG